MSHSKFITKLLLEHFVSRAATELSYIKRSSYTKYTIESNWTFELGLPSGFDFHFCVIVGFMQRDQFKQQQQNNDTFHRPTVVNAQSITFSEKYPDEGNCNFAIDKYSQACGGIVCCFRHLAKDNILQPLITQKDFITIDYAQNDRPGYL